MRNRKKQRELRMAGIKREENIGNKNAEQYNDPTQRQAVREIVKEAKRK